MHDTHVAVVLVRLSNTAPNYQSPDLLEVWPSMRMRCTYSVSVENARLEESDTTASIDESYDTSVKLPFSYRTRLRKHSVRLN